MKSFGRSTVTNNAFHFACRTFGCKKQAKYGLGAAKSNPGTQHFVCEDCLQGIVEDSPAEIIVAALPVIFEKEGVREAVQKVIDFQVEKANAGLVETLTKDLTEKLTKEITEELTDKLTEEITEKLVKAAKANDAAKKIEEKPEAKVTKTAGGKKAGGK